jgi:hypothetical protein
VYQELRYVGLGGMALYKSKAHRFVELLSMTVLKTAETEYSALTPQFLCGWANRGIWFHTSSFSICAQEQNDEM